MYLTSLKTYRFFTVCMNFMAIITIVYDNIILQLFLTSDIIINYLVLKSSLVLPILAENMKKTRHQFLF